jgi:hypothetical protein
VHGPHGSGTAFSLCPLAWTADAEQLAMATSIIRLTNTERPFNATNARIGHILHVSGMDEQVISPEIHLLSAIFAI